MCEVLKLPRSTYYHRKKEPKNESLLIKEIVDIFRISRNNYGTRKIKVELAKKDFIVSRRKIGRIMKQKGLVSNYTIAQFRPRKDKCNESSVQNIVERKFNKQPYRNVVVSDLTYVRVGSSWHYICILIEKLLVIVLEKTKRLI